MKVYWFFLLLAVAALTNFSTAQAQWQLQCTDSDGGINLQKAGEITVTAFQEDRLQLQRTFSDRNWLTFKRYVEFYCDPETHYPRYKVISCADPEAQNLPSTACPSAAKGSIMLDARHASEQPKNIQAEASSFVPYYRISLSAPAEPVALKSFRLSVEFVGLKKGNPTWVKITESGSEQPLGNALLAWQQGSETRATVIFRPTTPKPIKLGGNTNLTLWFQGLTQRSVRALNENQIAVTIESLETEPEGKIYFESGTQLNRHEPN